MHHSSEKKKPSPSPSRRGSSTGEGGSGSKTSTPAPSPQHITTPTEAAQAQPVKSSGSSTPGTSKVTQPAASPGANKTVENVGVISSVASATAATVTTITTVPTTSATATSVVQAPTPKSTYQESVITNTESMETKQTKKRKAVNAANAAAEYNMSTTPPAPVNEAPGQQPPASWENDGNAGHEAQVEPTDKVIKKAKTENVEAAVTVPTSHFSSVSPAPPLPPPPPPAHSPASHPSPRHPPSPMPGPSGLNQTSNIRSPSQPLVSAQNEMPSPAPHVFHQPPKQTMDGGITVHPTHVMSNRSWGGLNVAYEMQQEPKPGVSGMAGSSKDMAGPSITPMPPTTIRNKKRAAMTSVVAMANATTALQTATSQSLASVRRQPQPTPPPLYQESIKDSPPSSPSSERPLKPKMETSKVGASCTAPHMLGNELNPESGAAACLQEQLSAELAAHAAGSAGAETIIPPPLFNKAAPGASSSSGRGSSGAQSLDQLLERQWEQGSQFLMEQAQHFDIASLLSCLHQLRTENVRLEDHVGNLQMRRDHLLAVNARLAIPLNTVSSGPPEPSRCQMQRENGSQVRPPPPQVRAAETITSERSHQLIMREVQQKPS